MKHLGFMNLAVGHNEKDSTLHLCCLLFLPKAHHLFCLSHHDKMLHTPKQKDILQTDHTLPKRQGHKDEERSQKRSKN